MSGNSEANEGPRTAAGPLSHGARGCLWTAGGALLLLALTVALHVPLLRGMAAAMEVREPPRRADILFLLNGDARIQARADHAAALFRAGYAPRVVIARAEDSPAVLRGDHPNETEVNVRSLVRSGVPAAAILVLRTPGGVTSTGEEGAVLARYLRDHPFDTVLVVTTEFHTRRARWNLRRELRGPDVELVMSGARHPRFHRGNWWRSEEGLLAYVGEYLKFVHNALAR